MRDREPLRRPCKKCGEYFRPTGKACKLCEKCKKNIIDSRNSKNRKKVIEKNKLINKKTQALKEKYKAEYFLNKTKLDQLRDNMTLERWKILSKNYKLGKKIWRNHFNKACLAKDMDMAYTTVLRCLSLDKANKRSWRLVKEGKISVFKLAMICSLKNNSYQDRTVDLVIDSDLSTCQIKNLKINNIKDINLERHRLATEQGYSRKDSAYQNFKNWINRGTIFMLMDIKHLPEDKYKELSECLIDLNNKIENYNENLVHFTTK